MGTLRCPDRDDRASEIARMTNGAWNGGGACRIAFSSLSVNSDDSRDPHIDSHRERGLEAWVKDPESRLGKGHA